MKIKTRLCAAKLGLLALCSLPYTAFAEIVCNIDFAYGLVVNDHQLRVLDKKGRTVVQINEQKQLFVEGRWVALEPEQQVLLRDYAEGLHDVVPKMIILATEGVELATETVDQVYQGLVGSDHDSYDKLRSAMKRVRGRVKEKFRHASNHYFIGSGSLESVDNFVDSDIEAQLEQAISMSIGGILSAIGGISDKNVDISQDRVDRISRQLEAVGDNLTLKPEQSTLTNKAQWFCDRLEMLNDTEEKLRDTVPSFTDYNVIVTTHP